MAITYADLLAFNNVESTDVLQGFAEVPYTKPVAYVYGYTMSNELEDISISSGLTGSQAIVRKLGKGNVKTAKATNAGALDFNIGQTADDIEVIPIDDVISKAEKIYGAIEAARETKTVAMKERVVLDALIEAQQAQITQYLVNSATNSASNAALAVNTVKDDIIDALALLDYRPNTLVVTPTVHALLLKYLTSGEYVHVPLQDGRTTPYVGQFLGLNVIEDRNLAATKTQYVLYDSTKFPVFNLFSIFRTVDAGKDFVGLVAQGQMVIGGGRARVANLGEGRWAYRRLAPTT